MRNFYTKNIQDNLAVLNKAINSIIGWRMLVAGVFKITNSSLQFG
jgi:hypothetical protein